MSKTSFKKWLNLFLKTGKHTSTDNTIIKPTTFNNINTEYLVNEYVYDSSYNFLGEKVSEKKKYAINKRVKCGCLVETFLLEIQGMNSDGVYLVTWNQMHYKLVKATLFNTKEAAERKLKDMLANPNKYILKK